MHVFINGLRVSRKVYIYFPSLVSSTLQGVGWRGGFSCCLSPAKSGTVGFCPLLIIFTRCISTPWIFAFYGFSAVSNMDNHLKDPLRYWESFNFSIYMTLTEGVLKWSVNLLIMLLMLSKRGIRRCRRTCWTSPRELDLSISSDLLDGSPLFLSTPDYHTLVWRIFLCALSPLFYPLSKRFPEVLGRDCFDMSRGFLSLPYF